MLSLRKIAKYELRHRLGRGGNAEVWKAFDPDLRRFVAIKVLHAREPSDTEFRKRFAREAQVVAQLHHPHIVAVYEFSTAATAGLANAPDFAYMVMQFVDGPTLAEYLQNTSGKGHVPPAADVFRLFASLAEALHYAHEKGVIHRDVKPANILLDQGNTSLHRMGAPVLTDFGMVKLQGGEGADTPGSSGVILGTPRYISPEQAQGLPLSGLSDFYSLGIILYELCTGAYPYPERKRAGSGVHRLSQLQQHISASPRDPIALNPAISPRLSAVLLRCLAKDPADRFLSATAFVEELAGALEVQLPDQDRPLRSTDPSMSLLPPEAYAPRNAQSGAQAANLRKDRGGRGEDLHAARHGLGDGKPWMSKGRLGLLGLFAALLVLVVALSFIMSAIVRLPTHAPEAAAGAGGTTGSVSFLSSGQTALTSSNEAQVSLSNVTPAAEGKAYYVWLLGDANRSDGESLLLGTLTVSRGGESRLTYLGDSVHTNLLATFSQVLITEEDASVIPIVPSLNRADWRDVGAISSVPNPNDATNHFSLLDHLRHLLVTAPQLRAVGLSGGLDTWLYRNTLQVRDLAVSAQAAYTMENPLQVYQQLVRLLDYLDGTTVAQKDLAPGTPVLVDQSMARVGLLDLDPTSGNHAGFIDHIAFHLTGLDDSPGRTPGQHILAVQIEAQLSLVKQELEQARLDAKRLIGQPLDQLLSPSSLALLGDLVKQTNLAFDGQFSSPSTTSDGGVAWISKELEQLAEIPVMPYSAP